MKLSVALLVIIVALAFHYLLIYLPYLLVSRKQATQSQILKTALLVACYSLMAGAACNLIGISSSAAIGITAAIVYQMGRRKLQQSTKQAWASCGIYIGITIVLVLLTVYLMVSNETFRMMMMQ